MAPCVDVCLSHLLQVISVNDDVETTKLGQSELILIHTGVADLLPGAGAVGLASSFHSRLELVKAHQTTSQAAIVGDVGKQDPGCLIQTLIKDPVTNALHSICNTVIFSCSAFTCAMLPVLDCTATVADNFPMEPASALMPKSRPMAIVDMKGAHAGGTGWMFEYSVVSKGTIGCNKQLHLG